VTPESNNQPKRDRQDSRATKDNTPGFESLPGGPARQGLCIVESLHQLNEPVPMARDGLYESGIVSRIAKRLPQTSDGGVETILEVNESIGMPYRRPKFFPRDDLTAVLHELEQDVVWLFLDF
jgi:hypothetical protein